MSQLSVAQGLVVSACTVCMRTQPEHVITDYSMFAYDLTGPARPGVVVLVSVARRKSSEL